MNCELTNSTAEIHSDLNIKINDKGNLKGFLSRQFWFIL